MKPYYILSCDGGGTRGKLIAQYLFNIEVEMGIKIADKFDMFAGTSTGALISILLAVKKMSAKDICNLYDVKTFKRIMNKSMWDELLDNFQTCPKYDGKGKNEIICETFQNIKFHSTDNKQLVVTAYDIENRKSKVFASYECNEDLSCSDVAAASTAAPTFFPAHEIKDASDKNEPSYSSYFIDGGTFANDSSLIALSKAKEYLRNRGQENRPIKILSIGTGIKSKPINGKKAMNYGGIDWLRHGLISILMDETIIHEQIDCLLRENDSFVRINGKLDNVDESIDNTSTTNMLNMIKLADKWWNKFGDSTIKLLS